MVCLTPPGRFAARRSDQLLSVCMKRNLILYESVGTGKTHLAIALGVAACEAGLETRFFTAASLATKLDEARRGGTLEKLFQSIDRAELVILDEWGYLPRDLRKFRVIDRNR